MGIIISDERKVKDMTFFVMEVGGVKIFDCKLMNGKNGRFPKGPSKQITKRDGTTEWKDIATFSRELSSEIMTHFIKDEPTPVQREEIPNFYDQDIPF